MWILFGFYSVFLDLIVNINLHESQKTKIQILHQFKYSWGWGLFFSKKQPQEYGVCLPGSKKQYSWGWGWGGMTL